MRDATAWLSQLPTGLDRHVRLFSTRSRVQQLALYVKQPCTSVAFDCHSAVALAPQPDEQDVEEAPRLAPRKARKDKRSGAMIEAMARDAARRHAPHEPEGVAAPKRKKKKTTVASGGGLQLSIVYDE